MWRHRPTPRRAHDGRSMKESGGFKTKGGADVAAAHAVTDLEVTACRLCFALGDVEHLTETGVHSLVMPGLGFQ